LYPVNEPKAVTTYVTPSSGAFRFTGLKPGKYSLSAERLGFARQEFKQRSLASPFATAIVTGEGEDTEHLVFRMIPGAVLTGYVKDNRGEPVAGLSVVATRIVGSEARRRPQGYFGAVSDDRGYYRIPFLPAGAYTLQFVPRSFAGNTVADPEPLAYPVAYYPGVKDPNAAELVKVQPGKEVQADIVLPPVRTGSVKGTVAPGMHPQLVVHMYAAGSHGAQIHVGEGVWVAGNRFTFENVPQGHYIITLWSDTGTLLGSRRIEVTSESTEVTIGDVPLARITAKVQAFGRPKGSERPLAVVLSSIDSNPNTMAQVSNDGGAELPPVAPGRYRVQVGQQRELGLLSLSARGANVESGVVEIPETGSVELSIGVDVSAAELKGRVTRDNKSEAGILVLLVPRTDWQNSVAYRMDQSDSDGTFVWSGVVPGEYLMFAFAEGDPADYADPEAIRPLLPKGQPITVVNPPAEVAHIELATN
jgi:hypothetical protein